MGFLFTRCLFQEEQSITKAENKKKISEMCELRLDVDMGIRTCHMIGDGKKAQELPNHPPKDPQCSRNCSKVEIWLYEIGRNNLPHWTHFLTNSWAILKNWWILEVHYYVGRMFKVILVVFQGQILYDQEIDAYVVLWSCGHKWAIFSLGPLEVSLKKQTCMCVYLHAWK